MNVPGPAPRSGRARDSWTRAAVPHPRRVRPALTLAMLLTALGSGGPAPQGLPAIVFVSRRPLSPDPRAGVPGIGPRQRASVTGGRLLVRREGGRITPLVPPRRFFDVSHPTVSFNGRRVAFAAVTRPDSAWRIWVVDADGRNLAPVTRTDRASIDAASSGVFRRYDDLDPCWLADGRLCFSSTRYPLVAEVGGPVTNLFVVHADGTQLMRITSERDGAEKPSVDPASGRILYARWWGSRYRASDRDPSGITTDTTRALPAERLIVWHALTIQPDGEGVRLAGGNPRARAQTMAYQPLLLSDGTLVGVTADTLSLEPHPGRVRVTAYPGGFAEPVSFPPAPGQMCSPAPLPDGRLVVAWDPDGRGDFGIAVVNRDGSGRVMIANLRGRLELDPVALAPRGLPPPSNTTDLGGLPRARPVESRAELERESDFVRFDCLNVFTNAPVDFPVPDGPPITRDLRIRFFAALSRPRAAGGDTAVLVREATVQRGGAIHEEQIPGDVPMFEQLIDAHGHVLQTASGPAHVPGFNAGRAGAGTRCVGCHVGHSSIAVPLSYAAAKRFNAATSAEVTATSEAPGTRARALVDRRTRGPWDRVAWVARGTRGEAATLRWPFALAIDSLLIYDVAPDSDTDAAAAPESCDVTLFNGGRSVAVLHTPLASGAGATGLSCGGVMADRIELRPSGGSRRIGGVPRVGLAEVEVRARIPED